MRWNNQIRCRTEPDLGILRDNRGVRFSPFANKEDSLVETEFNCLKSMNE